MRKIIGIAFLFTVATSALAQAAPTSPGAGAAQMVVTRAGAQAASAGPAQIFTGKVRIDPLFGAHAPVTTTGASVTFEPGARSAWHTHPAGQILIVTAGAGRVQQWGGPVQDIRPGDVIWTPAGVKHWHGASPSTSMTHLSLVDAVNGKNVEWMEKVTDEQYGK